MLRKTDGVVKHQGLTPPLAKRNSPMHRLASLVVLLVAGAAGAEDKVHSIEPPLTKPKKMGDKRIVEPFDKVRLHVWIPDGVKVVRGAVVNPFNEKQVEQKHWQEACRAWGFALVGADYFGVNAADYAPTLKAGLKALAADLTRPELEHLPFAFVGMSAGAGMSVKFAEQMPERIVALGLVCLEVGPTNDDLRKIPTLTVFGEKDGKQMEQLLAKLPEQRKLGARWAIAIQWGRGHEFGAANNLVMPWFDVCIRLRLPPGADLTKAPAKLTDVAEQDGWVAEPAMKNTPQAKSVVAAKSVKPADAASQCWFPTEGLGRAWHGFVTYGNGAIASPAALGDKRPFAVIEAGKPVPLKLTGVKDLTTFDVFVSGKKVASLARAEAGDTAEFTIEKLPAGVHTLVVRPTNVPDALGPLKPAVVVVR